jgi:nicotinate-nucleotide pyrophosphorylase
VVCGVAAVRAVFRALDPAVASRFITDGTTRHPGTRAHRHDRGSARSSHGERTALNIFGRLCGCGAHVGTSTS